MEPPDCVELQVLGMPGNLFWERMYRLAFPLDLPKAARWVPRMKVFDVIYSHYPPMTWIAYLAKKIYNRRFIYYNEV